MTSVLFRCTTEMQNCLENYFTNCLKKMLEEKKKSYERPVENLF